MTAFTEKEVEYLEGQGLARLATVGSGNAPHVVPVGYRLAEDRSTIDVGGHGLANSKKYRDLQANPKVAIVIDDVVSTDPYTPRGVEVRGIAELHETGGPERFGAGGMDDAWIRIVPRRVTSWGLEGHAFSAAGRLRARTISSG